MDDFQRGLGDEHVNLAVVGDRELRSVPHLVETREHKDYDIITRVNAAESGLEKLRDKEYHGVLRKSASGAYYLDQTSGGNSRGALCLVA